MKKFLRFSFFLFFLFSLFFRYAVLLRYIEYNFCIHLHKRCTPLYNFLSVLPEIQTQEDLFMFVYGVDEKTRNNSYCLYTPYAYLLCVVRKNFSRRKNSE